MVLLRVDRSGLTPAKLVGASWMPLLYSVSIVHSFVVLREHV